MDPKLTQATVHEQRRNFFHSNIVSFSTKDNQPRLVKRLEIHPAGYSPRGDKGEMEVIAGWMNVCFGDETFLRQRTPLIEAMAKKEVGSVSASRYPSWFTLTPPDGVVSYQSVRNVLLALYELNALSETDVRVAAHQAGIMPPPFDERPALEGPQLPDSPKYCTSKIALKRDAPTA